MVSVRLGFARSGLPSMWEYFNKRKPITNDSTDNHIISAIVFQMVSRYGYEE